MTCPCGNQCNQMLADRQTNTNCSCRAIISGESQALTPLALMKSRYVAFVDNEPEYLFLTSSVCLQSELTVESLREACVYTQFVRLEIIEANDATNEVEFIAYYIEGNELHGLHERSSFVRESGLWKYDTGTLFQVPVTKVSRNDDCPCRSGKKFKKCHNKR